MYLEVVLGFNQRLTALVFDTKTNKSKRFRKYKGPNYRRNRIQERDITHNIKERDRKGNIRSKLIDINIYICIVISPGKRIWLAALP